MKLFSLIFTAILFCTTLLIAKPAQAAEEANRPPNPNFEYWSTKTIFDGQTAFLPSNWKIIWSQNPEKNIQRSTDSQNGSYSLRLTGGTNLETMINSTPFIVKSKSAAATLQIKIYAKNPNPTIQTAATLKVFKQEDTNLGGTPLCQMQITPLSSRSSLWQEFSTSCFIPDSYPYGRKIQLILTSKSETPILLDNLALRPI